MATAAQSLYESPYALTWFLEFLKEELAVAIETYASGHIR